LKSLRFAVGTAHAPMWLALLPQMLTHLPWTNQHTHMTVVLSRLGWPLVHYPAKSCFQTLPFFIRNSLIRTVFFAMRSLLVLSNFCFLPHFLMVGLSSQGKMVVVFVWFFWWGFDEAGREDHIEGAVEHHLNDRVKVDDAVIDHGLVVVLHTIPQPALGANLNGIEKFGGKIPVGGHANLKIISSRQTEKMVLFTLTMRVFFWAKEDRGV
jgi:hypothetical protein